MKKILSVLLALLMIVSLCACTEFNEVLSTLPEQSASVETTGFTDDSSETTRPDQIDPDVTNPPITEPPVTEPDTPELDPDGSYTTKEDVALYIHLYGKLPSNFITKSQAWKLGWKSGALEPYAPGKCIGGDTFQNREGLLPKKAGRTYKECDIDTLGGGPRGAKRIVFSNDGLIYYTDDHYGSFTLLYGEP